MAHVGPVFHRGPIMRTAAITASFLSLLPLFRVDTGEGARSARFGFRARPPSSPATASRSFSPASRPETLSGSLHPFQFTRRLLSISCRFLTKT